MLKRIYSNASIKYKILVSFWVIILIVSTSLGLNSYVISQNSILERAYASNLEMVRQIDYNVQYVQNDFFDTLTLMSIDTKAQELLMGAQSLTDRQRENYATWESQRLNSIQTMINLLVAKRYVSRIALYSNAIDQPISYIDKEGLSLETKEIKPFSELIRSDEYSQIIDANGRIVWFALSPGHTFFNVRTEAQQIVAARLVKELNTQKSVGILLVASDEILFEKTYSPLIMTENASVTR